MKRFFKFYGSRELVLIGYDLHSEGGAWRSIYRYFRHEEVEGRPVMLIDRRKQATMRQMAAAVCLSPRILLNGLDPFYRWEGILACLFRKDIYIYLHDTAHMLDRYARQHPWKFRLFRMIVRRNPVLCVSEQMRDYYRLEFGSRQIHVVHEAVAIPVAPDFEPGFCHIVMVGSVEERKGVKLLSDVAELAAVRALPWKFHWVGALASQSVGTLSEHVRWWGWQDAPHEFVRKADLFFLSSVDDPLPLACLEAMALGRRCVVYRNTGIAELLAGVRGCSVYEDYSTKVAFRAINDALAEKPDSTRLGRIIEEKASVAALVTGIRNVVGIKN
jgi:glycosyltransferase involved in cell wall biosynthesis